MLKSIRIITVFVMLACMLLVYGCGDASKDDVNKKPAQSENIKSNNNAANISKTQPEQKQTTPAAPSGKGKITVVPPKGWEPVAGSTALIQYLKEGASFIVTADSMPSKAGTPDAYIDFVKEQFSKTFDGAKFGNTKSVTIAGIEGRMLEISYKVSGFNMKYNIYYAFRDGKAYTFTCGAPADSFDSLKGDYNAFISSVKFE